MGIRVGVDIGGTFTDAVFLDEATGELHHSKVASTPKDYSLGVLSSIEDVMPDLGEVTFFTHGTTVGVNALIQGTLVPMGLLTTRGFRDVLELGRGNRVNIYDFFYESPKPLIPRYLRKEVNERVDHRGNVVIPLDEEEVRARVRELRDAGVRAIAVCFLNGYANPAHEQRTAEIVREEFPEALLSVSTNITREYREYERSSTTVINLGIKPTMDRYLTSLEEGIKEKNFPPSQLFIMQSNGGMLSSRLAKERPVYTIQSTLAGGIIAMQTLADILEIDNMVGADMGGTSFDVEMVIGRQVKTINSYKIKTPTSGDDGYPIMTPTLDVHSIGAGGGSIAWIDGGGRLHVGPQSQGPDPGPACYDLGGDKATVTDANVVLGRLHPEYLLGGSMPIRKDLSQSVIDELSGFYGMKRPEMASGILQIVCHNMAGAIRTMTLKRGLDPREFTLVAFGGAGPLHAVQLARILEMEDVLVVNVPGNFSAWGMLMAPVKHDYVQTLVTPLSTVDLEGLEHIFQDLAAEGLEQLRSEGVPDDKVTVLRQVDLRYIGQEHTLAIPIGNEPLSREDCRRVAERFDMDHERIYLHAVPQEEKEIVNVRVTVLGNVNPPILARVTEGGPAPPDEAVVASRPVFFEETGGFVETPIYDRSRLLAGNRLSGPAVIEEKTATTVLPPGTDLVVDAYGHLRIRIKGGNGDGR